MASSPVAKFSDPFFRKPGVVYFIGAGRPPVAIKIGVATNERLFERLRDIHGTNHLDPVLLGVVPLDGIEMPMCEAEKLEKRLHKRFEKHQLRKAGTVGAEWFEPAQKILDCIRDEAESFDSLIGFPNREAILKNYC